MRISSSLLNRTRREVVVIVSAWEKMEANAQAERWRRRKRSSAGREEEEDHHHRRHHHQESGL